MEALAALGLACNIFQVVSFGRETIQVAKEVYRSGRLDPHLTNGADALNKVISELQASLQPTAATTNRTPSQGLQLSNLDKQLVELAKKCQGAGRDLCEEVSFLNSHGTKASLIATIKTATKANWRKRRLETLERKLGDAERLMQTGLLAKIYERTNLNGSDLARLGSDLRLFVLEYQKGHVDASTLVKTEFASIRQHVRTESSRNQQAVKKEVRRSEVAINSHITHSSRKAAEKIVHSISKLEVDSQQRVQREAVRERLIRSLKFDRMNERRNQVSDSHPQTFQWVLRDDTADEEADGESTDNASSESSLDTQNEDFSADWSSDMDSSSSESDNESMVDGHRDIKWDSLPDWLRQSADVHTYWISGKPGSGKTTLMKYIISDPRTQMYLDQWSSGAVIIPHFIWRLGTSMQQSIKGLLCSLLYQLLLNDKLAIDHILQTGCDTSIKDSDTDWSVAELKSTLQLALRQATHAVCIFIDGLDEVLPSDGTLALLVTINWLRSSAIGSKKIKFCLGSRTEPLFEARLCFHPNIRLQDLNRKDLHHYADAEVNFNKDYAALQLTIGPTEWPRLKEQIIEDLVRKAEGVFLWLCLTVSAVNKAIQQAEPYEDLRHRIEHLPRDMEALFADMWARTNDDSLVFKARAAHYFRILIERNSRGTDWSVFSVMLEMNPGACQKLLRYETDGESSALSLLRKCEATIRDIELRCSGLAIIDTSLEVRREDIPNITPWHGDEFKPLIPHLVLSVRFVHRTVFDFLTGSNVGCDLLQNDVSTKEEILVRAAESELAAAYLFRWPQNFRYDYMGLGVPIQWDVGRSTLSAFFHRFLPLLNYATPERSLWLISVCENLFNSDYMPLRKYDHRGKCIRLRKQVLGDRYCYPGLTESNNRQKQLFLMCLAERQFGLKQVWGFLLEAVQARVLSQETKLELITWACSSGDLRSLELRKETVQCLLATGTNINKKITCSWKTAYELFPYDQIYKTPMQKLLWNTWERLRDPYTWLFDWPSLLQLFKCFLDHGASLNDEMYALMEIEGHRTYFLAISADLACTLPGAERDHKGEQREVVLAVYPAADVLRAVLCKFASLKIDQSSWPAEIGCILRDLEEKLQPLPRRGHTIAVGVVPQSVRAASNLKMTKAAFNAIVMERFEIYPLTAERNELTDKLLPLLTLGLNVAETGHGRVECAEDKEAVVIARKSVQEEVKKIVQEGIQQPERIHDYLARIGVTSKYVEPEDDDGTDNDATEIHIEQATTPHIADVSTA
ncbi:hypothetical protein MCOR25_006546 [Pyricularia grisea]|nr:hypothetical protein MCOR25_006546 [Pyricularia grisea]